MKEAAGTALGDVNLGVHICCEACAHQVGGSEWPSHGTSEDL